MVDKEYIKQLFEKYVANRCSPEESAELLRLFRMSEYRETLEEYIDALMKDNKIVTRNDTPSFEGVLTRMRQDSHPRLKKWSQKWIGIAASVLITLSIGGYVAFRTASNHADGLTIHDALPGTDRAVLTLANGDTIVLDSTESGIVNRSELSTISKRAHGLLVYQGTNRAADDNTPVGYHQVETPKGGQYKIALPDGTKVWLNASSSLAYPERFTGKERKVKLIGEGYFEVAHANINEGKPFVVESGNQRVDVLGTVFNINAYIDEPEIKTSLVSGRVRVTSNGKTTFLNPGQQSTVGTKDLSVNEVSIASATDWVNGDFVFNDESLESIMRKISRWYNVQIVYEPGTVTENYRGQIARKKKLSEVLQILELSGGIHFQISNGTVYVRN